jgi:thioredoxin-related protein
MHSDMTSKFERRISNFIDKIPGYKYKAMGFKGIAFEDSNDIRLSSIPYNCPKHYFIGHISYNKDGYTQHCNDYKSYQTWLVTKKRNVWVDVEGHGQKLMVRI